MATAPPLPSTVAGRYRPVAPLGHGGMGSVWEAFDERLQRAVALKVATITDRATAERAQAEARALAALHHPNVVAVLDAGDHEGRPFVVTELVRGPSLRDLMGAGPMDPGQVARIGQQLASALACAHERGIVHRDLTPANVLVAEEADEAKLIDFGIAASEHAAGLTATGTVVGTPAYLAPEQVEGRRATPSADVYALGLVLLEALTGRRPFPGGPTATTAARLVADVPLAEDLPPGWAGVIGPMTRRDPDERPTSAEAARAIAALTTPAPALGSAQVAGATVASAAAARSDDPTVHDRTAVFAPGVSRPWPPPLPSGAGERLSTATATAAAPAAPRHRAWPLVLAGTALVLALVVVAGFGLLQTRPPSGDPTDIATETTLDPAANTPTTPPTTAPAVVVTAAAPTSTTSPAPEPVESETSKGKGDGPAKGGAKGRGRD